jgi:hypothetical protein
MDNKALFSTDFEAETERETELKDMHDEQTLRSGERCQFVEAWSCSSST